MIEDKLTEDNKDNVFTCSSCKEKTTRGEIRKIWMKIPFVKEENQEYYCGCDGWN
jgi:hypothetical protein